MGISLKNELTNETKSSEFFIFSEKLQSIWKQFWPVSVSEIVLKDLAQAGTHPDTLQIKWWILSCV